MFFEIFLFLIFLVILGIYYYSKYKLEKDNNNFNKLTFGTNVAMKILYMSFFFLLFFFITGHKNIPLQYKWITYTLKIIFPLIIIIGIIYFGLNIYNKFKENDEDSTTDKIINYIKYILALVVIYLFAHYSRDYIFYGTSDNIWFPYEFMKNTNILSFPYKIFLTISSVIINMGTTTLFYISRLILYLLFGYDNIYEPLNYENCKTIDKNYLENFLQNRVPNGYLDNCKENTYESIVGFIRKFSTMGLDLNEMDKLGNEDKINRIEKLLYDILKFIKSILAIFFGDKVDDSNIKSILLATKYFTKSVILYILLIFANTTSNYGLGYIVFPIIYFIYKMREEK